MWRPGHLLPSDFPLSRILQMRCRAVGQWFQSESGLHLNQMWGQKLGQGFDIRLTAQNGKPNQSPK